MRFAWGGRFVCSTRVVHAVQLMGESASEGWAKPCPLEGVVGPWRAEGAQRLRRCVLHTTDMIVGRR
jgi:hypothetical protein